VPVIYHRIPERRVYGKPLGRHFKWDTRNYLYQTREVAGVPVLLKRYIAILNQGQVGSCTGNEQTGVLGTGPFFSTLPVGTDLNEAFALRIYSAAEDIDGDGPYPPNDNGSSGQSAAQAAKNMGLISGYTHATTVSAMSNAIQSGVPVGVGVNWYSSFDNPPQSGVISISPGAYVRGGHEFEVRGDDPGAQMFYCDNSWGTSYGLNGSFQMPYSVMDRLFSEGGDCTVCVPLSQPAPGPGPGPAPGKPTPADVALDAVAGPWAARNRIRPDLVKLKAAITQWETDSGLSA
jgi:papain like protease